MKSLTVWRGHSTQPSLQRGGPAGVCRVAGGTGSSCKQRKTESSHWGVSAPRDAKRGARAVRIPLFYCPIKSVQNKKSSTPQGAALGATGRIRTSGLPGRRTTTGRHRPALKRKIYWFCTVEPKTRKKPIVGCHNRLFRHFTRHLHSSGQMVVKNQGHSTRSIPVERFYRRKRCTIPADFVLIIDYTGGLFHKCFYFRVGTWPRHIDSPASLIGDEIKGIALRVAIEIALRIYGIHIISSK